MTTMRIGIVAPLHHPIRPPFAGGLERQTHALATGLRARGHDVVLFAAPDADSSFEVVPIRSLSRPLRLDDTARADVNAMSEHFLDEHHAYLGLMLQLDGHGCDVVHVNALHYLPVAMAGAVRVPLTLTLHTPPTPWLTSALRLGAPRPTTIAVSRAMASAWQGIVPTDHVIPNGVDLDAFRHQPDPRGGYAVWTGRVCPEKGTLDAVTAARRAGVPLHVAGPSEDAAYLRRVRHAMGPQDRLHGLLDDRALHDLVANAAVQVVSPRWDEPYGLVVAEALASGTPVVAYARGGIPEIVDDHSAVLVRADDVGGLAAAIVRSATLDRDACRRRAEQVADARTMVAGYEDVFQRVRRPIRVAS